MEFLRVNFQRSRRVSIDNEFNGRTNTLIQLEAGKHSVSLGPPYNFTPEERTVILKDTSSLEPREVSFELQADE